ncbi:MAG TPA: hypothetical protein VG897_07485 [Terriglobales bacterium]|nr:hypothetical protein [Terriglobales bacterium]
MPAILALCLAASAVAKESRVYSVNGRIPLGIESFRLEPAGRDFYLMASVENPAFDGLYWSTDRKGHTRLFGRDDNRVMFYPERIQFRVTASAREKLVGDSPFRTRANLRVADMLQQLRFRVKVFHALEYRYMQPVFVREIGVPADVPYEERIYQIGFEIGKIPIDDRVVMEVFSPTGERLCKFHLDLY